MKKGRLILVSLIISISFSACENLSLQQDQDVDELTVAEIEIGTLKALESIDQEVDAARFAGMLRGMYPPHYLVPRYILGNNFPSCATVTVDSSTFPKQVTIDYGSDCETRGGMRKSGTIIITLSDSLNVPGASCTVEYTDLYVGKKLINLSGSITYEGLNESGNAVVNWESNATIIINDSVKIVRSFTHSKEWLSGYGTPEISDDIFLLTGNGEITINDTYEFSRVITDPLLFDRSCRFPLSGIVEITKDDESMTIDYGDGECDNIAVVTKDGESEEIELLSERFNNDFKRRNKNMNQKRGWW